MGSDVGVGGKGIRYNRKKQSAKVLREELMYMSKNRISTTSAVLAGANLVFRSGITPDMLRSRYSDPEINETTRPQELAAQLTMIDPMIERMCEMGASPQEFKKVVTYAYVLMDANRYPLDIRRAYEELEIGEMGEKYFSQQGM